MNALKTYLQGSPAAMLAILFSLVAYYFMGYELDRSDFGQLMGGVLILFAAAGLLINNPKLKFWHLVLIGLAFRLILIVVTPNLSQDFYRFIWDGRIILTGLNPYDFTVFEILTEQYISSFQDPVSIPDAQTLFNGMGDLNASHYSNYPPLNQGFFVLAAWLGGNSILGTAVAMRVLLILADLGILWIGKKALEYLKMDSKRIFWYFLNPYIIIELTGNLHFEGSMLFFLLAGIYLVLRKHYVLAGCMIGLSISVKLIPLMLLPLFFRYFIPKKTFQGGFKNLFEFYGFALIVAAGSFLAFLSMDFLDNFSKSIGLWFQTFEFNASVYYIIRWIGYQTVGWNIIADVGKILPLIIVSVLCLLGLFRKISSPKDLFSGLLLAVSFYFLLSTTVHPWYVATPLLLSIFTRYRFALVWSLMIFLSYSAYGHKGFDEKLHMVAIEYLVVLAVFIWDLKRIGFRASSSTPLPAPSNDASGLEADPS
ncbi:glycosyltransferase 87 family protein [Gilvibacter sp.]|uniref:glycosyltransferase 87 family protein n=1 Tax=Gilvibacter sp. TaxID=2729997 RepID=UPI003F49E0CF